MKNVKIDLPKEVIQLKILPISDLHIGAPEARIDLIQSYIDQLKEEENTYCILGGDLIDNAIIGSVGDVYEQRLTPMGQLAMITSMFAPVKHKILGVVQGNHEARSYKQTGIDLMALFCSELEILDRYDPVGILIFLRFGKQKVGVHKAKGVKSTGSSGRKNLYTIYLTHGIGGGRTVGAKANTLERIGNNINADILIVGHTHLPITFRTTSVCIDVQNSSHYIKEQVFINMASTQGYSGYPERFGLKPSSLNNPCLLLSGITKKIEVIA